MWIATEHRVALSDASLEEQLRPIPPVAAVYALRPAGHAAYVGSTSNLQRRLRRLLITSSRENRSPALFERLRAANTELAYWVVSSRLETALILYALARREFNGHLRQRRRVPLPWYLSLLHDDPFARLQVSNHLGAPPAVSYGPFRTRSSAEAFEQGLLGLFQLRRCTDRLQPGADHPGCMYGEMNLCLRPCQLAVTRLEYNSEVERAADFLAGGGTQLAARLSAGRDQASQDMDFELAARLHKQFEKVRQVMQSRNEIVADARHLSGVAITRGRNAGQAVLWLMRDGLWQQPVHLTVDPSSREPLDQTLRAQLAGSWDQPRREGDRKEELALLSQWYYSSSRDGEWLPFSSLAGLRIPRLVRAVSQLLKPEPAESSI